MVTIIRVWPNHYRDKVDDKNGGYNYRINNKKATKSKSSLSISQK